MLLSQKRHVAVAALIATLSIGSVSQATASNYRQNRMYEVTVTNVTKAVQFTPILSATHKRSVGLFEAGSESSAELALLAEGGDTGPLQAVLDSLSGQVAASTTTAGLLFAGQTSTFEIRSDRRTRYLSMAAMLLPTNDSFMALDTVALPVWGSVTYFARGYDAGSELNDELCANIPGPTCGGTGPSPDEGGEGFVHISSGIHGIGDIGVTTDGLSAAQGAARYDWRDAVAKVTIRRVR